MCGPSAQEESLANNEASLSSALATAYGERFATQNDILGQVQGALGQLQSGNYPPGYSPAIMSTLQTGIINNAAGASAQARQAAANAVAGQGAGTPVGAGGGSPLLSGPQQEIQGQIASSVATEQANALNKLNVQSADLGRQNLIQSISGLQTLAGAENPLGFGQQASSATGQAFGQANTINQQQNQKWADITGGITGIAKAGLSVLSGGASNLIQSPFSSSGGFLGTPTAGSLTPTDMPISGDLIAPQ